jgi:cytochrome P450
VSAAKSSNYKWATIFLRVDIMATPVASDLQERPFTLTPELLPVFVATILMVTLSIRIHAYCQYQRSLSQRLGMPVMHHPRQGRSFPWLGQVINFICYRPWDLLTDWHYTYGPIVCFTLLGKTMFSIGSPNLLKQVLQSKIAAVKKDVANTMKDFLVILGTGIVTSESESWMKQRLKMSHPLRRDVLEIIPRQTLTAVQQLMLSWDEATASGGTVPLGASLRHLTLQVISGSFLSLTAQESDSTFAKLYLPIVDESNTRVWHPYRSYFFFLPFWWRYLYNVRCLNVYVSGLIRSRWRIRRDEATVGYTKREIDILDRVLLVYEKDCGGSIPDVLPVHDVRQFRDEMKTFMLAGHETSAAMMTWALYELIDDDSLLQNVLSEANSVFSKTVDWSKAQPTDLPKTEETLSKLIFSEASLREALRKYSVVPVVARRTISDLKMGSYLIPQGSSIIINMQAVHLDATIWPNPMKFDPTRFLPDNSDSIEPYTFLPFIAGPRNCLGQHLALLESKMVISWLVQRYKISLPTGQMVQTEDWSGDKDPRHRYMVPVIPKEELMVHVALRSNTL